MEYFQICPLTKGKAAAPVTVNIISNDYLAYARYHLLNAKTYYRTEGYNLEGLPERLCGKIYRNMQPLDFMAADPSFMGQVAVVSRKVLDIIEEIVDASEYTVRPIVLEGVSEDFYLVFTDVLPMSEVIISESSFSVYDYDTRKHRVAKYESFLDLRIDDSLHPLDIIVKDLVLPDKYAGRDIIRTQFHPYISISERFHCALMDAGISGMDTVKDFAIDFK